MAVETLEATPSQPTPATRRNPRGLSSKPRAWNLPTSAGGWIVLAGCALATLGMLVAAYVIITSALSGSTGAPNFFLAFPDAPSLSLSAASRPEP